MKKKYLIGTGITLVLLIAVLLGASQYMLNYSLRPENRGRDLAGSWQYMFETYPYLKPWVDSLQQAEALKDTFIYSPDQVKLHAYYVSAAQPTARTAVIVHGYTDNTIRMMMIGYLYSKQLNFNILLPDLRDTGLSGGDAIQMGWLDRKDVIQWDGHNQPHVWRQHPNGGARHLDGSRYHHDGFGRTPTRICEMFCRRLRIYQRVGAVLQGAERTVRSPSVPFNVHRRLALPVGIWLGI